MKDHLGPDQHHEPTVNSNQATVENVSNDCVDDRQTDVRNDSPNEQEEAKQGVRKEQYMNWGRENEKHAAATVLSYALPLYFPGTTFVEAGASFIKCEQTHENLVEVSTDGLICSKNSVTGEMEVIAKTEFKCLYPPIEDTYKLPVYHELPLCTMHKALCTASTCRNGGRAFCSSTHFCLLFKTKYSHKQSNI